MFMPEAKGSARTPLGPMNIEYRELALSVGPDLFPISMPAALHCAPGNKQIIFDRQDSQENLEIENI